MGQTSRPTSWRIFPPHSQCHPGPCLVQRFGKSNRLGQEFPFRCEVEPSPVRVQKDKQIRWDCPCSRLTLQSNAVKQDFLQGWKCSLSGPSNTVATSCRCILSPCNVASATRELNLKFYFVSVNVNSPMELTVTVTDGTALEKKTPNSPLVICY